MIKRKVKKSKRKNPYLQHEAKEFLRNLDPDINFKFIGEGNFGETYYFKTNHNILYRNIVLKPNQYILKIYTDSPSSSEIQYLIKLSKYGLIPKIYYINYYFAIMKYIEGETLWDYGPKTPPEFSLKLKKLIKKWHELGFAHGDISDTNILVTESGKIYLIDPYFENKDEFQNDLFKLEWIENRGIDDDDYDT